MRIVKNLKPLSIAVLSATLALASNVVSASGALETIEFSHCVKSPQIEICSFEDRMTAYNSSNSTKVVLITGDNYESGFTLKLKPNEKREFKNKVTDQIDQNLDFKIIDDFSKT